MDLIKNYVETNSKILNLCRIENILFFEVINALDLSIYENESFCHSICISKKLQKMNLSYG
ncbi:hypothetical protein JW890_05640 [candidate division WOR-3 bacterium]|nr:hypothetical protein [candidate division WOR-3 bacterium]